MNNIKIFGKLLDQPILISKLNKSMPAIMTAGACVLFAKNSIDTFEKAQDKKTVKKEVLKNGITLSCVVLSSIFAPKIASKVTKRNPVDNLDVITKRNEKYIDEFLNKNPNLQKGILEKAKNKVLSFNEIKTLHGELSKIKNGRKLFDKLIPEPENISSKDIFSEIGYLSTFGAIPVVGGIAGGCIASKATNEDYKKTIPDKISEGIYQYLANIFMCNVGAGVALGLLEKMNISSKTSRAIGMTLGIILTGVLGGSKIANLIAKNIVSPVCKTEQKERTPEMLDMCLHADDIATVSLLSGLKWIEPMLPILYGISGYRAGIGYRN